MATVGRAVSGDVYVTVRVSVPVLPAASATVTVMTFWPLDRAMPLLLQLLVPLQVPLPPRLFDQLTEVTATLSAALPPMLSWELLVE